MQVGVLLYLLHTLRGDGHPFFPKRLERVQCELDIIMVAQFHVELEVPFESAFSEVAAAGDHAAPARMLMLLFLPEDVHLGVDVLAWMCTQLDPSAYNVLHEPQHALFNVARIRCLLNIELQRLQCLLGDRGVMEPELDPTPDRIGRMLVDVYTNKDPHLLGLAHEVLDTEVPRCAEVPDERVEMVHLHMLEDALDLLQQGVLVGVGEKLGRHQGYKVETVIGIA